MTDARASQEIPLPAPRSNRPVTLGHRLEFALTIALFGLFRIIGVDAASGLAGRFTRFVGPLLKHLSLRARTNLRAAFPDWTEKQIEDTVKDVWENLGRTAAEFAHFAKFDPQSAQKRVTIVNEERARTAIAAGRPAIFVSSHMANWETLAIALKSLGADFALVYRAANNHWWTD